MIVREHFSLIWEEWQRCMPATVSFAGGQTLPSNVSKTAYKGMDLDKSKAQALRRPDNSGFQGAIF